MKTINNIFNVRLLAFLMIGMAVVSCGDDDAPPTENLPEVFTDVTLIFTPAGGGTPITATANDDDGEGPNDLEVLGPINLAAGTTYTLTFNVENTLDPNADLNAEILEEDNEHQIFFAFTDGAFTSPTGDGNIGATSASDPINYGDMDENMRPVGLVTTWSTSTTPVTGTFTANLQHQPGGVKTDTSNSTNGDTDFDLEFVLNIQ